MAGNHILETYHLEGGSKKNRVKKLQRIVMFMGCFGFLLIMVGKLTDKFFKRGTGTSESYKDISTQPFPVLTICPSYPYKDDRIKFHGLDLKKDLQFKAQWVSNQSGVTPKEFYNDVVYSLENIVLNVLFNLIKPINGDKNPKVPPTHIFCGNETIFKTSPYYYNGDCFSMDPPKCLQETGILEVVLTTTDKTDIFIHHRGQFLSPNSRSRVDVDKGRFVKLAINHEITQLIGEDGSCSVDLDNYDGCIYDLLLNMTMGEVGCTIPWLPGDSHWPDVCGDDTEKRKRAFTIYQENRRNQKNVCPNTCLSTNVFFGPLVTGRNEKDKANLTTAVFYFRKDVKSTYEYFIFTMPILFAEMGGYIGLLLGISLFDILILANDILIDKFYRDTKTTSGNVPGTASPEVTKVKPPPSTFKAPTI